MLSLSPKTLISSGLLLLLAMSIWIISGGFPNQHDGYPGPSLFPRMIAIGLGMSGLILLFRGRSNSDSEQEQDDIPRSWWKLGAGMGLGLLFPLLAPYLDLSLSAGLVCLGISFLFEVKWKLAITISLGIGVFLYLIFTLALGITV